MLGGYRITAGGRSRGNLRPRARFVRGVAIFAVALLCRALPAPEPVRRVLPDPGCADGLNEYYHQWRNQKQEVPIEPNSALDSYNPQPHFPARTLSDLRTGLRNAHARGAYWKVSLETRDGRRVEGRVRRWESEYFGDSVAIETAPGRLVELRMADLVPERARLIAAPYDASHLNLTATTRPSEIARDQGLLYAAHGVKDIPALIRKLGRGRLMPGANRETHSWRNANYLELVGPDPAQRLSFQMNLIFRLRVLDREDYFVTPSHNYGTRGPRTVDATDKKGLARIFWEIAGRHDAGKNEVVVKEPISYEELVRIEVPVSDRERVLRALRESGIEAPGGRRWEDLVVGTDERGTTQHY